MSMTHYMSLLASNQPWNLIIFMAIPVICAETLTISEFFIIFDRVKSGGLRTLNKIVGIFAGFYFTGIFFYLLFKRSDSIDHHKWLAHVGRRCGSGLLFERRTVPIADRTHGNWCPVPE